MFKLICTGVLFDLREMLYAGWVPNVFYEPPSCFLEKKIIWLQKTKKKKCTGGFTHFCWLHTSPNNLSQMPSATRHHPCINPPIRPNGPHFLELMSAFSRLSCCADPSVVDDVRSDQCHLFLHLIAPLAWRLFTGRAAAPSSHPEKFPLKERERAPLSAPLHLLALDLRQQAACYLAVWNITGYFCRMDSLLSGSAFLVLSIPQSLCSTHQYAPRFCCRWGL